MTIAETDVPPPDGLRTTLAQFIMSGFLGYSVIPPKMTESLASKLSPDKFCRIAPEWIVPILNTIAGST